MFHCKFYSSFSVIREGKSEFVSDLLWVVKFYEGGLTFDSLMDMPLDELQTILEETNAIAMAHNGK